MRRRCLSCCRSIGQNDDIGNNELAEQGETHGGPLNATTRRIGNGADTTEDTLFTATIPANTFDIAGRQILLEAFGAISATGATKTVKVYFGTSIVFTAAATVSSATTAGDWSAQLLITKVGSSTQIAIGTTDFSGAAVVRNVQKFLNGTETDTAGIVVKVTGRSSAATANTVTCNQFTISGYN